MAPASSTVDEAAGLLRDRIRELDSERERLERALSSLTDGREGRRGPGRPRGSSSRPPGGGKRRRSRKGGTRAEHATEVIAENPGISAGQIADKLGMKPNYMYRVLTELQADGKVRKDGRAYYPA
ncbi:MAG TPA: winged helix-turn-helix transcriptional regulator [Solirubrobacterales bacterium]|nr:winged helix-turn-helix transcriptional regulator [Solirubrobacterales bacterium]